jgi:hypothetical protein
VHWTFLGQVERGQRNLRLSNLLKIAGHRRAGLLVIQCRGGAPAAGTAEARPVLAA